MSDSICIATRSLFGIDLNLNIEELFYLFIEYKFNKTKGILPSNITVLHNWNRSYYLTLIFFYQDNGQTLHYKVIVFPSWLKNRFIIKYVQIS